MLLLQELVYDPAGDAWLASREREVPTTVDARNIVSYCRVQYGQALDVARTVNEAGENVFVGWTFRLPRELCAEFDLDEGELVVIPHIVTEDGGQLPLFDVMQEQRAFVERLVDEGKIDKVLALSADEPWELESHEQRSRFGDDGLAAATDIGDGST